MDSIEATPRYQLEEMSEEGQTLYERIGGETTIDSLMKRFYARVLDDPELNPFFKHASMEKLLRMQREFFSAALDGPVQYSGLSLSHAHYGRGITRRHFTRFVEHLLETLRSFDLNEQDIQEIIRRISVYADEITGDSTISD